MNSTLGSTHLDTTQGPKLSQGIASFGTPFTVANLNPEVATTNPTHPWAAYALTTSPYSNIIEVQVPDWALWMDVYLAWTGASVTVSTAPIVNVFGKMPNPSIKTNETAAARAKRRRFPEDLSDLAFHAVSNAKGFPTLPKASPSVAEQPIVFKPLPDVEGNYNVTIGATGAGQAFYAGVSPEVGMWLSALKQFRVRGCKSIIITISTPVTLSDTSYQSALLVDFNS